MGKVPDRRAPGPSLRWMERGRIMHRLLRCYAHDARFQVEMETLYRAHEGLVKRSRLLAEGEVFKQAEQCSNAELGGPFVSSMRFADIATRVQNLRADGPDYDNFTAVIDLEKADAYVRAVVTLAARWKLGLLMDESDMHTTYRTIEDPRLPGWLETLIRQCGLNVDAFTPTANWQLPLLDRYAGIEAVHDWFTECHLVRPSERVPRTLVHERFAWWQSYGGMAPVVPTIKGMGSIKIELADYWLFFAGESWETVAKRLREQFESQLASEKARIVAELESHGYRFHDTPHRLDAHVSWTYRRLQGERVTAIADSLPVNPSTGRPPDHSGVSRETNAIAKLLGFAFPRARQRDS